MDETPALADDTSKFKHVRLHVAIEGETLRRYVIRPGQVFVLGRTGETEIVVKDPRVSRRHASVELRGDGLYLTDLDSRNGTYVEKDRLESGVATKVRPTDQIQVGRHELLLEMIGFNAESDSQALRRRKQDEPLLPPEEFELLEEIGTGSVGHVWVARQKLLGRKVAIKFLRRGVDDEDRQRFLREVRVCCQIKSPYVVECYDVRVAKGHAYMIMELVHGPTALDMVSEGPLPLPDALRIGEDVARGLAAARDHGVVHRDVKPANILIHPGGAKLSDFGIAKVLEDSACLTETGMGLGSLPYASPEQVLDAKSADHRADIYGLGATLYHLLTGRPLFKPPGLTQNIAELVKMITEENPISIGVLRPDCPEDVAQLVHRMLHKSPEDRPQDTAALAEQLGELRGKYRAHPNLRTIETRALSRDLEETSD